MLRQKFGVVQAQRTSANLLEPQHHRASKVWRGLSPAFGVVRLYRTFSNYSSAGETRCAGCLCTSSGWFKHSKPHRTYTNHRHHRVSKVCRGFSQEFGVVRLLWTFSLYSVTYGPTPVNRKQFNRRIYNFASGRLTLVMDKLLTDFNLIMDHLGNRLF